MTTFYVRLAVHTRISQNNIAMHVTRAGIFDQNKHSKHTVE